MIKPNAMFALRDDSQDEHLQSAPRTIPLGLSVYVGDITTAVMASKEAVQNLLLARADNNLRAMRDACREIESLTRKANTLSDVLDDKIWELQNRDTRVRG
jgi:hypothetical protein